MKNGNKGFSLAELIIGVAILTVVIITLLLAFVNYILLNDASRNLVSASNNGPSDSHIKFRQVEGWDISNGILLLSSNFVEYSYFLSFSNFSFVRASGCILF